MKRLRMYLVILLLTFLVVACQPSVEETQSVMPSLTQTKTDKPTLTKEPSPTQTMKVTLTKPPEPINIRVQTSIPMEDLIIELSENKVDSAEMVYVPAGEFLMGSEEDILYYDEAPEHTVYVDAYWIYKHEVTNSQFAAFLNAEGNQLGGGGVTWLDADDIEVRIHQSGDRWVPYGGYEDHPVVEINWFGADTYCEWAGGRLPTEAEWEKAARGTDGRTYPWGNSAVTEERANYCDINCVWDKRDDNQDDGYSRTSPVGSFPDGTSPYGALDMAGNVWEWVADPYIADYLSGESRISRGGSYLGDATDLRVFLHVANPPDKTNPNFGFRCVLDENAETISIVEETQPEVKSIESSPNEVDSAEMVFVSAGEFMMGSNEDLDECPEHNVYVDAFWIYKYEVTNVQFAKFVNETLYETTAEIKGYSHVHQDKPYWRKVSGAYWAALEGPGSNVNGLENYPVIHVSWSDAKVYCQWAGGRLPTEAEWEKAARGTDGRTFPWGDEGVTDKKANFCDNSCKYNWKDINQDDGYSFAAPVGIYPIGASPYGALDMAGNVREWVADWYDEYYYLESGNSENPQGPPNGDCKSIRGGSWFVDEWLIRTSKRGCISPDYIDDLTGFRCVLSAKP